MADYGIATERPDMDVIDRAAKRQRESGSNPILREIEYYLKNPPEHSVVLTISPEQADAILDKYNIGNRSMKPGKMRGFSDALSTGGWLITGDTIKFSDVRRLVDGQNRLMACKHSGVPMPTHVVFGIPDAAFAVIDTGQPRSQGDVLSIAKIKDHTSVAHIVAWMHTFDNAPGRRDRLKLTPAQTLDLYHRKYKDCSDHLGWGSRLSRALGLTAYRGALLHYAFTRWGGLKRADAFMTAWCDGGVKNFQRFPQVEVLRKRIYEIQAQTLHTISGPLVYASAIKAWNAYVQHQPITLAEIKWGQDEPFPVPLTVEH